MFFHIILYKVKKFAIIFLYFQKALLRDSKRAGYHRLTDCIYKYREYEVNPKPPPKVVKEKIPPDFSRIDHGAQMHESASSLGHSGHVKRVESVKPSRPMPSFVPLPVTLKMYFLLHTYIVFKYCFYMFRVLMGGLF